MKESYRKGYLAWSYSASFRRRKEKALNTLRQFFDQVERPYLSWSGGKDSLVCMLLVREIGQTGIPVFTQGDDLDWPDKKAYCHAVCEEMGFTNYHYLMSDVSALKQIAAYDEIGEVRGTFSHVIRRFHRLVEADGLIMGLRSEESRVRRLSRARWGLIHERADGLVRVLPIADWKGQDVMALIVREEAPLFHVYHQDKRCAPHEIRMSWPLNPEFFDRGEVGYLKMNYPDYYRRLSEQLPWLNHYA